MRIPDGWQDTGDRTANGPGLGKGSPASTPEKPRKTPGLVPQPHGGAIKQGNNPGPWPNSGRKPERIRIRATEGADELLEDVIESTRMQLADAKNPEVSRNDRQRAHAEGVRGFKGLVEAGPGTKVTNVVEREGVLKAALQAFDSWASEREVEPSDRAAYVDALTRELGEG